jgi:hypothetical protein
MDIQTRKIVFVQEFLKLQNEDLISEFEKLMNSAINLQNSILLQPMSIEELNIRIDKSINDSLNEQLTESKNLLIEIEKWG